MTRIDGYLSSIAQRIDPTALVVIVDVGFDPAEGSGLQSGSWQHWVLRRPGSEDIRLGAREPNSYGDALQALQAWCKAQKARGCRNCGSDPHTPTCVVADPVGKARS